MFYRKYKIITQLWLKIKIKQYWFVLKLIFMTLHVIKYDVNTIYIFILFCGSYQQSIYVYIIIYINKYNM